MQARLPAGRDSLERDVDVEEKKVRITLRLDESVAKFCRAMGQGQKARMNRIPASFARIRIAHVKRLEEMTEDELAEVRALRDKG